MRLIDADALLWKITHALDWSEADTLSELRNAPTVTLQPTDGDAISREAAIAAIRRDQMCYSLEVNADRQAEQDIRMLENLPALPSLPVATPAQDVDRVTAEDVVEGIEWFDGGQKHLLGAVDACAACVGNSSFKRWFSKKAVAAMLNAAESVTWPEGHPRNPKPKQPTLLEAAKLIIQLDVEASTDRARRALSDLHDAIDREEAAIEREKGGGNEMKNYWLSWISGRSCPYGAFELHAPWWVSGYWDYDGQDGIPIIVAAIRAESEADAWVQVAKSFDDFEHTVINARFIKEQPDDWEPFNERFPRAGWMQWPEYKLPTGGTK